ncbi:MAG: hypothetical protein WC426_14430 [Sulfuriferula sp.]
MNDVKIKQQIIDKIKASTNILVTVSNDPSVDALSAALGLTVLLNKLGKHTTAVFSGAIPPAITFLDPQKTFESTTDSLRDFIIALDKEKADHLRYKVEGDVVKIFITPYRTTITSDDLDFSQGDYNVELVLALGVDNQDHLDSALEAHGKILHDATVATFSAGEQSSQLGSLDWREEQASSLSEMLVSLSESFKSEKDANPLIDSQIATAFLTGIVAATDRFSNPKTSSKVMTIAAQLMAAGADQQLIASKLEESHEIGDSAGATLPDIATSDNGASTKINKDGQSSGDGGIDIAHTPGATLQDITNEVKAKNQSEPVVTPLQPVADVAPASAEPLPAIKLTGAYAPEETMAEATAAQAAGEPSLGGTLNATTEQAAQDAKRELENDQNKTILSHAYLSDSPSYGAAINSAAEPPATDSADIFAKDAPATSTESAPAAPGATPITDIESQTRDGASRDDALAAVHATFDAAPAPQPFSPAPGIVLPPPPPLPDFSTMPPAPAVTSAYAPEPVAPAPERLGDIFPDTQTPPVQTNAPADPGQFQIPGQ